mgnify:CR=1 FL=1
MNISNEKMTFLTANYGLSPDQITRFYRGYCNANASMGGEIEASWDESGWTPEDPEACMIECLTDADRLERYIDDYDDWCFGFLMKAELAHDLLEVSMPKHLLNYLSSQGKSSWMLAK